MSLATTQTLLRGLYLEAIKHVLQIIGYFFPKKGMEAPVPPSPASISSSASLQLLDCLLCGEEQIRPKDSLSCEACWEQGKDTRPLFLAMLDWKGEADEESKPQDEQSQDIEMTEEPFSQGNEPTHDQSQQIGRIEGTRFGDFYQGQEPRQSGYWQSLEIDSMEEPTLENNQQVQSSYAIQYGQSREVEMTEAPSFLDDNLPHDSEKGNEKPLGSLQQSSKEYEAPATTIKTGPRIPIPNMNPMKVQDNHYRNSLLCTREFIDEDGPAHACNDPKLREPKEPYDPDHIFKESQAGRKRKRS